MTGDSQDVLLETARRAARASVDVILAAHATRSFTWNEKARADFVTEVDVAAEAAACRIIRAERPHDAILAEEGSRGASGGEWTWVIDPLDGTTNFIRAIPFFAVAVSLEHRGQPIVAVIADPLRAETYHATRGGGAWLEDHRLEVSGESDIAGALALTGIPFRDLRYLEGYLPGLERVARSSAGIRRMGSAALDLAAIAAGRAEAFWEHGLSRWDVSAGALLVEEAGGRVTDLAGGSTHLDTGHVLATNGRVHEAMLRLV